MQVVFSSLYEVLVPFTRDFDQIKAAADELVLYDKSCLDNGLSAARDLLQSTWAGIPSKVNLLASIPLELDIGLLGAENHIANVTYNLSLSR